MKENNGIRSLALVAVALMMVAITVVPVAADPLPDYRHIYVEMVNGARFNLYDDNTYYIKFDGGGLNALHITNNPALPYGQVTNSPNSTGTFYVSDTGGRGYDDDIILMFATNNTTLADNFSLTINSSGYQWTPTADGAEPVWPDYHYEVGAVNESTPFDKFDLIYGLQTWKPSSSANYPIFYGENVSDSRNNCSLMFIDLNVGALGINSTLASGGMAKVDYTLNNFDGFCAFNAYAWCNQSNQGQGISWTNRVADAGSSGYMVSL